MPRFLSNNACHCSAKHNIIFPVIASIIHHHCKQNVFSFLVVSFQEENENDTSKNFQCVFWDFDLENGRGDWSNEGCMLVDTTESDRRVVCHCNHLTSFAVLIVSYRLQPKNMYYGYEQFFHKTVGACHVSCNF